MALLPSSPLSNFQDLRREGIQMLEVLSSARWDDFNTHDPGITILESVCLALTELGLKANAAVPDLISQSGSAVAYLPTTQAILTNDALTNGDFQKIIADTSGVQRGWYVHNSLPQLIFFFKTGNILSYDNTTAEVVRLKGLFDIYFQPQRPDLVGNILRAEHVLNGLRYYVEVAFPYWGDFPLEWHTAITIDPAGISITDNSPIPLEDFFFVTTIKVSYNGGAIHDFPGIIRLTQLQYNSTPINRLATWNDLSAWLMDQTTSDNLVKSLANSIAAVAVIHENLSERLQKTRNLCTDILTTSPIRVQEVSINAELEIGGASNLEEMIAQLYLRVDEMISPRVLFENFPSQPGATEPAESYEGPLLVKGILTGNEFTARTVETLYTSDFINVLLQDNEGPNKNIVSISELSLTNYLNNYIINPSALNCLKLANPEVYRVKFSAVKSNIKLFKEGSEITYDKSKMLQYFYKLLSEKYLEPDAMAPQALIPVNTSNTQFDLYNSIQRDFPEVYGIDEGEIPVTAPVSRIAEVRQLKGYLLFFEQSMANITAQIANSSRLFDIDPLLSSTRFTLPLYDVPDIWALLKHYFGYSTWDDFVTDTNNGYVTGIQEITEDKVSFLRRRIAFLDHLLARFGEDVHEYSHITLSYYLSREKDITKLEQIRENAEERLILDRIRLLKDLSFTSSSRGRGMHFQEVIQITEIAPGSWNWNILSDNHDILLKGKTPQTSKLNAFNNLADNLHFLLSPGFVQLVSLPSHQIIVFDNQLQAIANIVAESQTFATAELASSALKQLLEQAALVWDGDNTSGLERRVGRLLGFSNIKRRNLVHVDLTSASVIKTNGAQFAFSMTPPGSIIALQSDYIFANAAAAISTLQSIIRAGVDTSNYSPVVTGDLLTITLKDPVTTLTAHATLITNQNTAAEKIIRNIAQSIIDAYGPQEGFYVIEHLLLRPKVNGATGIHSFIKIPDAPIQLLKDPYSYQVTVVIPDGTPHDIFAPPAPIPSRFADPAFVTLVKKTIQRECPAHVMPRFLVLNVAKMSTLQNAYRKWVLLGMTTRTADEEFAFIQNDLILALTTP